MSWITRLTDGLMATLGTGAESAIGRVPRSFDTRPAHVRDYDLYEDLYSNHFTDIADTLRSLGYLRDSMRGLRNPAHAVVEYYVATVWPKGLQSAFPFEWPGEFKTEQRELVQSNIERIWRNSQWSTHKNLFIRQDAKLGDAVIKVATNQSDDRKPDRVFFRIIHPAHVTDFDTDERGFITYIRLDVPTTRRLSNGDLENRAEIEVWDKATGRVRLWDGPRELLYQPLDMLGTPDDDADMESYGVDFVPFTWTKFRDNGEPRGASVLAPGLAKIIEIERGSSRLNDLAFRFGSPTKVVSSAHMDSNGKPMRPPPLPDNRADLERDIYDERVISLPSGWNIASLVDQLPYIQHLEIIKSLFEDMRQTDYPELTYNRMGDMGRDLSGRALAYMLTPAIAKTEEARANADAALIRANQMALTIAGKHGLLVDASGNPLRGENPLGRFENGDFEHWFGDRPVIPLSEEELAGIDEQRSRTAINRMRYGWTPQKLLEEDGIEAGDAEDMLMQTPSDTAASMVLENPGNGRANDLLNTALARGE